MAIFCAIPGLLMLIGVALEVRMAHRLATGGDYAVANIIDLETYRSGDGTSHIVHFAFLVGDEWIERRLEVSRAAFESLQEEGRIPVKFWKDDPTVVEIELAASRSSDIGDAVIGTLVSFFFLFLAFEALSTVASIGWLYRHGTRVQAEVTEVREATGEDVGYHAVWIQPDGRTGTTLAQPTNMVPAIGSQITILTDPSGKRPGVWEDDV